MKKTTVIPLIILLSFISVKAQNRGVTPPPFAGLGMEWMEKKGKFYLTGLSAYSALAGKIPEKSLKKTWIAAVINGTTGKRYYQQQGAPADSLLNASIGPENSEITLQLVLPGKKNIQWLVVYLKMVNESGSGVRISPGSADEKQYMAAHYPYNYAPHQLLPNTDGDSLNDMTDKCPDRYGYVYLNGCPGDRDSDGVYDTEDKCPDQAGKTEYQGCPDGDLDMDGISDEDDECPYIPGWSPGEGCDVLPDSADLKDGDGDETPDVADQCPGEWGPLHNKGCPDNTQVNLPAAYWSSLLRLMVALSDETDTLKLKGAYQQTMTDSARVHSLLLPIAGIEPDKAWYVEESSGSVRIAMDFGYTSLYKEALRYYAALATTMQGLSHRDSTYAVELTFSHDALLYTPETPMVQFTPYVAPYETEDDQFVAFTDVLESLDSNFILSLGVYELENAEGQTYYAVRLWVN